MEFLIAAVTLGFLGSFHCVGMCGPIALALPLKRENAFTKAVSGLFYNGGRVVTYGVLGLIFGLLGKGFVVSGYQQALSILLGAGILFMILAPSGYTERLRSAAVAYKYISRIKSGLGFLFNQRSYTSLFTIGLLNGLLPCGLVYLGVAGAIATGEPVKGSLFMMTFGVGTLPALFFVSIASNLLNSEMRGHIRRVIPAFVVIMAIVLIMRGMNLGIPYISPELSKTDCTKQSCCHKQ